MCLGSVRLALLLCVGDRYHLQLLQPSRCRLVTTTSDVQPWHQQLRLRLPFEKEPDLDETLLSCLACPVGEVVLS